jgi:putative endonuclease
MLRCADGSYYVGITRKAPETRLAEHNAGVLGGYTASRRPCRLVFAEAFETLDDAMLAERRLKRWSRVRKQALIAGDPEMLRALSRRPDYPPGSK